MQELTRCVVGGVRTGRQGDSESKMEPKNIFWLVLFFLSFSEWLRQIDDQTDFEAAHP